MPLSWLRFSAAAKLVAKILKISGGLDVLAFAALVLLHTGLARRAFFELFAYVKGVEVPGPAVVREPPTDSPYELWLRTASKEIPMFEGLMIDKVATITLKPWQHENE